VGCSRFRKRGVSAWRRRAAGGTLACARETNVDEEEAGFCILGGGEEEEGLTPSLVVLPRAHTDHFPSNERES